MHILTATAASTASRQCSDCVAWALRLVKLPMSWASRHGMLGASPPRACSSPFAVSSSAGTRLRKERKPRRPDENDVRTTLGAAAGRPAAPYDVDDGFD